MFQPARRGDWTDDMPYACRWKPGSTSKKVETLEHYRSLLDRMTPNMVRWMPFIKFPHVDVRISLFNGIIHCCTITESYMSNRVMRQFGYIQVIPPNPIQPQNVCRESRTLKYWCEHEVGRVNWVMWMYHCMSLKDLTSKARFAGEVSDDYMDWFLPQTHPRVSRPCDEEDEMQLEVPSDPRLMTSQAVSNDNSLIDIIESFHYVYHITNLK